LPLTQLPWDLFTLDGVEFFGKFSFLKSGLVFSDLLTTEIIVVQLLFHAKIIDVHLYTALLASSSVSSILVPLIFTFLARKWGDQFLNAPSFQKN
jgi:hypothetical protein